MKFNFKQSLLLIISTAGILSIAGNINMINSKNLNSSNINIKTTKKIRKIVTAEAEGNIVNNTINSNLSYHHSQFSPTGIFVTKSSIVNIFAPRIDTNIYAFIGQWGPYQNINDGKTLNPEKIILNSGINVFIPSQDGMLYISNQNPIIDFPVIIDVENGIEVPTFKVNETTNEEFNQKLNETSSPFVELIGNNVFGTFQINLAKQLWKNNLTSINKINDTLKNWDEIYELSNYTSGLSSNFDGIAQKYHNKIQIANPDNGGGYAYATNYYISFQNKTGAGKDLFINPKSDQWGLWHEIGHTYQNPDYDFSGFGEVTVNINSFWVQEELSFRNRIFGDKNTIANIKNYVNSTDPNKKITDLDVWGRLGIFLQLHMTYGKEFFPTLNQEYRVLTPKEKPITDAEKYQTFIKMTSKTTNRNLIPFFEKWGIHANQATINTVAQYPQLTKDIWNNIFDNHIENNAIIDYKLNKYEPVSGVKIEQDAMLNLNVGNQVNQSEAIKTLTNITNDMKIEAVTEPNWNSINWKNENTNDYSTVTISEPNKTSNKYLIPTKIITNNTIRILGLGDIENGIFGLNTTEKKLFINPRNNPIHSYFKNKAYVTISVTDENNDVIYNMTVNGDEATMKFTELNNISYKNNYKIKFWFAEANRGLYYGNTQWNQVGKGNDEIIFHVINDNLMSFWN